MPTRIGVVGPCASGKSTLVRGLRELGYEVRHIAQEHSYVPYMWERIAKPDLLIYLGVSFENTIKRKQLGWNEKEYQEQIRRLRHAQQHAHLIIETDSLTPSEVLFKALEFINAEEKPN